MRITDEEFLERTTRLHQIISEHAPELVDHELPLVLSWLAGGVIGAMFNNGAPITEDAFDLQKAMAISAAISFLTVREKHQEAGQLLAIENRIMKKVGRQSHVH